jgi:hypothetical protein
MHRQFYHKGNTHRIGGYANTRVGLDVLENKGMKISYCFRESNHDFSVALSIAWPIYRLHSFDVGIDIKFIQ